MKLNDLLVEYSESERKTVAVPMANNEEIIDCIGYALKHHLANFILIGEKAKILAIAEKAKVDISSAAFEQATEEVEACNLAARLCSEGKAHIMMKGLVQTSSFTRAILNKEYGLIQEGNLISHVSVFELPEYHKLLILTDAAINIEPDLDSKEKIMKNAINTAKCLGLETPKVAVIAPVEKLSPKIQSTVDAAELKQRCDKGAYAALVDGPMGFDLAVSKKAAEIKGFESPIAGDADILLMPNLDSGNVAYKVLTKFTNAKLAATLAGTTVPVVLTSRADSEETKLLSLALAVKLAV